VVLNEQPPRRSEVTWALEAAGLEVVGEAQTAKAGVHTVLDLRPDVVLMDLAFPEGSAVEAIEQISLFAPAARILVLAATDERPPLLEAIVAGASGCVERELGAEAIVEGVKAFAAGECVISSPVAGALMAHIRERDVPDVAASERSAEAIRAALTKRELQVFRRLVSGESNREIGQAFALSENTIKNHVASILAKLHLENRVQAAVHAVRSGLGCVTGIFMLEALPDEVDVIPRAVVALLLGS
jgi:DNA-binding NarL/FixJ family response regulator